MENYKYSFIEPDSYELTRRQYSRYHFKWQEDWDRQQLCELFDEYFVNIGPELSKAIPQPQESFSTNTTYFSMFISPAENQKILQIVPNSWWTEQQKSHKKWGN